MSVSWPWTIALATAGVTAVLVIIGMRASARSRPVPFVTALIHLLAGGLIGYLAVAFFPALPAIAAIGGTLGIRAIQSSRWVDASLLAAGFGASWTVLVGWGIVNDRLDPAVHGQDQMLPFVIGAAILVAGLLLLVGLTLWPGSFSRSRD